MIYLVTDLIEFQVRREGGEGGVGTSARNQCAAGSEVHKTLSSCSAKGTYILFEWPGATSGFPEWVAIYAPSWCSFS